jgi:hypothetical protein
MKMARIDYRPWACTPLVVAVLAYVGCTASSPGPQTSVSPTTKTESAAGVAPSSADHVSSGSRSSPVNLLASLGNPAAILIVSGERNGYLEPCGCSEDQEGGLIRLYDLVDRLHKRQWPSALVDLGTLIKDPASARGGFDQAKIKFDYAIKALKLLNYEGIALSAEDLKVGVGESLGLFDNSLGDKTKIVVANVQPEKVFDRFFRPSIVAQAGPVKLGVTAIIDPESLEKLNDPQKNLCLPAITSPEAVLPGVLAELEPKSDFQVLLVQGSAELAQKLALANPGFDIVVATSHHDDVLNPEGELLNGGKTRLVTVGKKGKYVGLFAFYPQDKDPLRFQLVTLNKQFDDPAQPMKALIQDEYRNTLKAFGVVENLVRRDYASGAPGATFVGADTCKECHPNTVGFWSTTMHADAYDSLKHDPKPNTIYDAECVACHTTGFEYNSGWKSEAATPQLAGNQCENCHGPGSKHSADPANAEFRKLVTVTAEQADKNGLCYRCHDPDNSPKFEFKKYWSDIVHKGKDKYDDPKVHRGITPKRPQPNSNAGVP